MLDCWSPIACFGRLIETDEQAARKAVRLGQVEEEKERAVVSIRSRRGVAMAKNVSQVVGILFDKITCVRFKRHQRSVGCNRRVDTLAVSFHFLRSY